MREDATKALVANVDGNPLNMMLALIQLLSQNFSGTITEADVKRHEPWNRLFLLDIDAAERDELDWHFLLAMSHARTEIVRFEEVWWRIRMISPRLTRRVEDLRRSGVLERLWLLGFLGRTIHGRPYAGDSVRFVEFFHANLRDYLLREVMGQGRSGAGIGGRHGGTPAAWRALDRLSVFAHDWAQTVQLLPAEEIRVLMEHRDQVIETRLALDEDATLPFQLLFLRERGEARKQLSKAAMECFAFSALVHDEAGRWAVETLFTDVDDRVVRCRDWLLRCPVELRPAVLRYLIPLESPSARKLLTKLIFDLGGPLRDEMAQAAAAVLTAPLFAARWRNELLLATLGEALRRVGGEPGRLPAYVPAFVVSACGHDRDTLAGVINYCVDRLSTSEDANLRALAPGLETFSGLDGWLGTANVAPLPRGVMDRGATGGAPLELVLGHDLRWAADDARLADWSASLRDTLGVPVPDLELRDGEVEPDEAELRFYGQRISRSVFRPDLLCVSKRLWELAGGPRSSDAVQGVEGGEDVLWLPAPVVAAADFRFTSLDFDGAVGRWLESRCRRSFDQLFDVELQLAFVREVASTPAGRRRLRRIGGRLRTVLVNLVEEGVPLGSRDSVLEQLADLAPRITRNNQLTQKIREYVKADLCRSVADESGQVTTILLDERLEQALADRVVEADGRLALNPSEAIRLDAAIQRHVIRSTEDGAGPPLVVVTVPGLRAALARLLQGLDYRLPVLSFTELEQDLIAVPGGLVDVPLEHGTSA